MQKGKVGIYLWVYPFIALWSVLVGNLTLTAVIAGFAIAVEKDTWCSRQTLHAFIFHVYWSIIDMVLIALMSIPFLGSVFAFIDVVIWIILLIIIIFMGFNKVKVGLDMTLPGKDFAEKAFGIVNQFTPPQPQYNNQYQQQYQQPNNQQQYQQPNNQQQYQQQQYQQPQQQTYQQPNYTQNNPAQNQNKNGGNS